MTNQR